VTESLELSRRVLAEHVGRADMQVTVEANPDERAAVAARLMIPAIESLRCEWVLRPSEGGMIQGQGVLQARVTQLCVITVEPFDSVVRESFEVHFVLEGRESEEDDPDEPDQLVYDGVAVDIGEATVEQLALTLDPNPRKPNATLPILDADEAGGPFAALAKLRDPD
jgi:hypothetical protein